MRGSTFRLAEVPTVQPASLSSRAKNLFEKPSGAYPPYSVVAMIVAAAVGLALFAAVGLAQRLAPGAADGVLGTFAGLLDPLLLALLAAVAVLAVLALWTVVRYERRLELFAESRARNRAIVDNMLDGAIHIDALGRIAGMNRAAERLFDYQASELKGQPVALLFGEPLRGDIEAAMREHPELGLPPFLVGVRRLDGQRRDGTTLPLDLAITEVHVGGYLVYTAIARQVAAQAPE